LEKWENSALQLERNKKIEKKGEIIAKIINKDQIFRLNK